MRTVTSIEKNVSMRRIQWPVLMKGVRTPLWMIKIVRYEYWPFWLFFFPLVFYYLYLAVKAKSLTYFTAANPGIDMGGVFGESKISILQKMDVVYLPKTVFVSEGSSMAALFDRLKKATINFPLIVKPNVGERGQGVEKIDCLSGLQAYLQTHPEDLIIQEYLDDAIELGILYYRYPDGSGSGITSVVKKAYLKVTGDGRSTVGDLLQHNVRARFQLKRLQVRLGTNLFNILSKGETLVVEPIGNHCRGTRFLNANDLINEQLVKVFDGIAQGMEGFCYGRFDLKVKDLQHLYAGHVRIMEVNGVTSEPGHVYDPAYKLWMAYRDIAANMKILYRISQQNRRSGCAYVSSREVFQRILHHFTRKTKR